MDPAPLAAIVREDTTHSTISMWEDSMARKLYPSSIHFIKGWNDSLVDSILGLSYTPPLSSLLRGETIAW